MLLVALRPAEAAAVCWCLIRLSGYLTSIVPDNDTQQLSGGFSSVSPDQAVRLPGVQVRPAAARIRGDCPSEL